MGSVVGGAKGPEARQAAKPGGAGVFPNPSLALQASMARGVSLSNGTVPRDAKRATLGPKCPLFFHWRYCSFVFGRQQSLRHGAQWRSFPLNDAAPFDGLLSR